MGSRSSKNIDETIDLANIPGLLHVRSGDKLDFKIENLVFSDGGAMAYAYIGALEALDRLHLLKHIKRVAGVGTGALIAVPLALGMKPNAIQMFFRKCLDSFHLKETQVGKDTYVQIFNNFGILSCNFFLEQFNELLESMGFPIGLTFEELYLKTGFELCIVVSNLTQKTLEHCHPKTTPNLPINQVLLMSLCVPGIFAPTKYSFGKEACHYLGGNLMCSFPIYCFDGWWLSMKKPDSFPNRKQATRKSSAVEKYFMRNKKTLGLVLLDRHLETNYPELNERLINVCADSTPPETPLKQKYQKKLDLLHKKEAEYLFLRKAGLKLLAVVNEIESDILDEQVVAKKIMDNNVLSPAERKVLFSMDVRTVNECVFAIIRLNRKTDLEKSELSTKIETMILKKLREYYHSHATDVTGLNTYFGALSNTVQSSSFDLAKEDHDRTVGIMCKYICSYNISLTVEDLRFLFKQGWNATVAYMRHMKAKDKKGGQAETKDDHTKTTEL